MSSKTNVTPLAGDEPDTRDRGTRALDVLNTLAPDVGRAVFDGGSAEGDLDLLQSSKAIIDLIHVATFESCYGEREAAPVERNTVHDAAYLATRLLKVAMGEEETGLRETMEEVERKWGSPRREGSDDE